MLLIISSQEDVSTHGFRTEIKQVRQKVQRDWSCTIQRVPRDKNVVVDALTCKGGEEDHTFRIWRDPPPMIVPLIVADVT